MATIDVKHVYKLFGPQAAHARVLDLLRSGRRKAEVLAETGCNVGLNDVSLGIESGEIFVIMGLSGSGKSTLVRHFNRLIEPTAGEIVIDGSDVIKLDAHGLRELRRYKVSMVFQNFGLLPHQTVLDNAAYALRTRGEKRQDAADAARNWLTKVGLDGYGDHYPDELSGGMRQRVGLARALAADTDVLLMDEAFSALDPLKRREMQDVLLQLQKEQRRTIMFVSHDLEEALRIGNRIAIMEGGRLVQVGTPQDIIANPADDYVRAFFDGIDTSRYLTAGDLMQTGAVPIVSKCDAANVAATLNGSADYAFVLDAQRKIRGFVTRDAIGQDTPSVSPIESIRRDASLEHVVARVVASPNALPVVDDDGCYCGSVDRALILKAITRSRGSHV